jgi:biopolymer transport protein TolR
MPAVSSRGRGRRTISEPNMVPFIDVMLVLLIIFMVTAPLISPSVVDLPSVGSAAKQPDVVIQIVVGKDNLLEIKGQGAAGAVKMENLANAVRKAQAAHPPNTTAVVISADKSVQYERVVKVMDTLQRAGIARIGLSVQLAP